MLAHHHLLLLHEVDHSLIELCNLPLSGAISGAAAQGTPLGGGFHDLARGIPYSELTIGVPKETYPHERRVAQTPETISKFVKEGMSVRVEGGAGMDAGFSDEAVSPQVTVEAGGSIGQSINKPLRSSPHSTPRLVQPL